MAQMIANCPNCNIEILVLVGQSIFRGELEWHRSFNCPNCGAMYEEDGSEEAPEDIKKAIIEEEGLWGLSLVPTESKTIAYKALRESLGLSLSDIAKLSKEENIMSGTKTEVHWLKNKLEDKGVPVVVKRLI